MAELTKGQIEAQQNLARLTAMTPEQYVAQYAGIDKNALIMADQRLQDMLTSSEGAYDPRAIETLMREREALAAQIGGREQMARQDYANQLKQAQEYVQWWNENPEGHNPTLRKLMPMVAAIAAVVATAGAASSALSAAAGAGEAAAAAAAEAGWAGIASEAVAGINAAGISGSAITAALPAVNSAVTAGIATAAASSPAVAATIAGTLEAIPVVTITGTKVATTSMLPALVGSAAAAGAVASNMIGVEGGEIARVEVPGQRPPEAPPKGGGLPDFVPTPLPTNPGGLETLPDVKPTPTDPTKLPSVPSFGDVAGAIGNALTGPALAAALGALTTKDMPVDAGLNSSIDKLTQNSDAQMKEWNEWMYPQLKGALADNKTATDAFVGKANANAGQLEVMGASARGLGDLYNQRNNNIYIPLADKIIADANKFNKEGFAEQQAGLAVGDLSSAYAAQRQQRAQQMAQYGVDPSSGRAMAIDAAGGINHAANSAAAATRARMAGEELWGKKQMDALGTSTALNANAASINSSYRNASDMYTGATGLRQQGVKATTDYFTSVSDLAKTSTNTYAGANTGYSSAGQLGLGRAKIESDRYIAEQEGRGKVIGAGLQAINSNGGVTKTVGDLVDTGGKIWNVLKGIWE